MKPRCILSLACLSMALPASAQQTDAVLAPLPRDLPGKGLAQHPFLYCGEYQHDAEQQTIWLVRGGKVVWTYQIKLKVMHNEKEDIQELGDCTLLSNGNVIFTTRFGAAEVTPDKRIVWQYLAPDNTEIHSLQPLGVDRVLLTQNGNPAKALTINRKTNKVEHSFTVPVGHPDKVHGQLRRVHLTAKGTYLVPHMDRDKVIEYDSTGRILWSFNSLSPWNAVRLKNGNTLISSNKGFVREVAPDGKPVWEFNAQDARAAGYELRNVQEVTRLANGNTIIANWVAGAFKPAQWPSTVQIFEVTPAKKIVWALSEWRNPNLGPATSIQLLDQPGLAENGDLQR